ncbi:hypothetical protein FHX59_002780 [Paraburkholderia silvatlantica]|uniref:Lipoprotein signal peptidase n=1 Tax=Paraburkholderia silvatlantica TaxID=321895 RepID=A0ABR6FLQ1_9BURK|nr:hypothetical protein [Paraburkholderia silvatlantica]PVY34596.1 hypothetical protein C7411_107132 [Paraburkholderia silvatlantica]PXW38811.1 hypothetical protein C7413_107132 [Paraburkholderia silvatlantica]
MHAYIRSWLIGIAVVLAVCAVDSLLDRIDARIDRCSVVRCV